MHSYVTGCRLAALISLAEKTKVLRNIQATFPNGLIVTIDEGGEVTFTGIKAHGQLKAEVSRQLALGLGEVTATHAVTGRVLRLGKSALER